MTFNVTLTPSKKLNGVVNVPGSKSYTNRAILIASISDGPCNVKNILDSDDTRYMIEALIKLGIPIERADNNLLINGNNGNFISSSKKDLFCGIAGTTSRFLSGLSLLLKDDVVITGNGKILDRPIDDLVVALRALGCEIEYLGKDRSIPILIHGNKNIDYSRSLNISGKISSQFLSSILMVAPRLQSEIKIDVIGDQVSKSYVDITTDIMNDFGVAVKNNNYQSYLVPNASYKLKDYIVEGDMSGASYFFGISGMLGGDFMINNVKDKSVQGDRKFVDALSGFGCGFEFFGNSAKVTKKCQDIDYLELNMSKMPDTAMTMMIIAAIKAKKTKITGLSTLKDKECDRIEIPKLELAKFGINCETTNDSIVIHGQTFNNKEVIEVDTHDDHRIAMSFALLGTQRRVAIKNAEVVSKSFPNFWDELRNFGVDVEFTNSK